MKLIVLLYLICFVAKAYCSAHNHLSLQVSLLILAAADDTCIGDDNCGPKMKGTSNEPEKIIIGQIDKGDGNGLRDVEASIFDIIPALRKMPRDLAEEYYRNVLFPAAKTIYKNKFQINNGDNNEIIARKIEEYINRNDLFRYVINDFSTFENDVELYFDPIVDSSINQVIRDNVKTFNFIDCISDENAPINFDDRNLNSEIFETIVKICREDVLCRKRYFNYDKNGDLNVYAKNIISNVNYLIIKTGELNNERYHFIVKDIKNERLAHPFTVMKDPSNPNDYIRDYSYDIKELNFYNTIEFDDVNSASNDLVTLIEPFITDTLTRNIKLVESKSQTIDDINTAKDRYNNNKYKNALEKLFTSPFDKITILNEFNTLNEIDNAKYDLELFKFQITESIFNKLKDMDIEVNYQQCQRFSNYIFEKIKDHVKNNSELELRNIIDEYIEKENTKSKYRFNNLNIISLKYLINPNSLDDNEIVSLIDYLQRNGGFDDNDIRNIRNRNNDNNLIIKLQNTLSLNFDSKQLLILKYMLDPITFRDNEIQALTDYLRSYNEFDDNDIRNIEIRNNDNNLINKLQNILNLDYDSKQLLIYKYTLNPNTLDDNRINALIDYLRNYNEFDDNDINNIRNRNNDNNLINKLENILNNNNNVESITKFFNKINHNPNGRGNEGNIEDTGIDLLSKCDIIFSNTKKGVISIPQINDINNYPSYINNEINNEFLNSNIVLSSIKKPNEESSMFKNLKDGQRNPELELQLHILNEYLNDRGDNLPDQLNRRVSDNNRWIISFFESNIFDLQNDVNDLSTKLTNIKNTLESYKVNLKNDEYVIHGNDGNLFLNFISNTLVKDYDMRLYIVDQYENYLNTNYDNIDINKNDREAYTLINTIRDNLNKNIDLNRNEEKIFRNYLNKDFYKFANEEDNDYRSQGYYKKYLINKNILEDIIGIYQDRLTSLLRINNLINDIIANHNQYLNDINRVKNEFNGKIPGLEYNDDLLNSYINYNDNTRDVRLISFADMVNSYTGIAGTTNEKKEIIKNLSITSDYEHMYAVSIEGEVFVFTMDSSHISEIIEALKITKVNNGEVCNFKNTKRGNENDPCLRVPKIFKEHKIESYTLNMLSNLKNFDSNFLPNNIYNIENIKELYKYAESFENLWEKMTNTYIKNIKEIDQEMSTEFIQNMYYTINDYKELLSNSEYNNNEYIKYINENIIENMEIYFYKAYNIHKYYGYGKILDNHGEEIKISDYKYDLESKLGKNELIDMIRIIVNIVNKNDINENQLGVIHIGNKILSTVDYKTIMPESNDIVDAIEKLISKFNDEETTITENEKDKLMEIYFKLSLLNIYNHDDNTKNIDLVNYLIESIGQKIGMTNSENPLGSYNLRQDNISLKIPELEHFERIEDKSIIDIIKDEYIPIENKIYILKGLESDINNLEGERLTEEHINSINEIHEYINLKSNQIKSYELFEGHEMEINNISALLSHYNNLVSAINEKYGDEYEGIMSINKELEEYIAKRANLLNNKLTIQDCISNLREFEGKFYKDNLGGLNNLEYEEFINELQNLEKNIFDNIIKFKNINDPEDRYQEAFQLVELLNQHNELISDFTNNLDLNEISKMYSVIDPIYIYNDNDLNDKLKYLVADKYVKALTDILELNKEKFNIDKNIDVKTFISTVIDNSETKLKFSEGYELPEINIEILNKIFNKNFNSENEIIDYIINNVSDESQLENLKNSYELKRKLIEHESITSRDENSVKVINDISKKLGLNNNDDQQLKTFQNIIYDSFIEFLEASSKFDDYVRFENLKNDENGNLDISDTYINYKGLKVIQNDITKLFGKLEVYVNAIGKAKDTLELSTEEFNEYKNNIELSVSKLKDFINLYVNELSGSIDKENIETFNKAYTYLENIVTGANSFIISAADVCENEELKNDVTENIDKLNEFKNLNDKYKEEVSHLSVKPITISVPKPNIESSSNNDESYDVMNLEEKILKVVKNLKKYDSENIKVKDDEIKIQRYGDLYDGATTLIDVLEKSLESYRNNINNIENSKESRETLINMHDTINILAYRYAKSEYLEDNSIIVLVKDILRDLSNSFDNNLQLHNIKFNEKLKDNNGNEITNIIDYKSIANTNSKYVNDMLRSVYRKLFNIFDSDVFNIGLRDNMETNGNNEVNKIYMDNRRSELEFLRNSIAQYEVSDNDKEYQKRELLSIYREIEEIEEIFDRENNNNIKNNSAKENANNSEAVYSLSDSLYNCLIKNFNDDDEIKNLRNNYNSKIGNQNKSEITSENVLNLDYLIKNINSNYFINDPNYKMYVNNYFTYMKHRLLDSLNDENEFKKVMNNIETAINDINKKINNFNNYKSPEGHYKEADHLIELSNNVNEFIDFCMDYEIDINRYQIKKIDLNDGGKLSNKLNYIRVKLMIDTFDEIAKSHPEIFKLPKEKSLSDYIEPSISSIHYTFGGHSIYEPVKRDLQSIIRDKVESKQDAIITFVDNASNNYQIMKLERSFGMKYKLTIHESSFFRLEEDVNDMNKLLQHKHFINHLKNKCIKRLETYDQTRKRLDNTLSKLAKLTDIDVDNTDSQNIVNKAKEMALNNNVEKETRNKIIKHLNNYIDFHKNEVIKVSGKVPSDVFKTIYDHSLALNKISMDAIEAIEFKSSDNNPNNNHNNKLENAMNYNNKFEDSNSNTLHKQLPESSSIRKSTSNNNHNPINSGSHNGQTNPGTNHNPTKPGNNHGQTNPGTNHNPTKPGGGKPIDESIEYKIK
ncbi:hypothetical protein BCR32DRAFT_285622 [Anaeromyces robustus]|uniref:VWFA domain-containing protein n=1 Tax=Anaeromyces robustus TaxID=1754192 RepID=A0A1Y1WJ03_9FUNG|nr:hypothetical protein BCR32DRAFT_285622 [Anaeromyces robustus]|eukprot:ORX73462.1 hypothetical protein BCR32DRAFT_285622 [Anaeromyces robustus]